MNITSTTGFDSPHTNLAPNPPCTRFRPMDASQTYPALLEAIRELAASGQTARARDREHRKVRAYWDMGDSIHAHLLTREGRPQYGDELIQRLAQDLSMDRSLLYLILQFRRAFPTVDTYRQLEWSHFRALLPLTTRAERESYARTADRRGWSVRDLKSHVRDNLYSLAREVGAAALLKDTPEDLPTLQPRFGKLYTYRLCPTSAGLTVDLGFGIRWTGPLHGLADPQPGMIITSERHRRDAAATYHFTPDVATNRHLYTFAAHVDRVIDGDTLLVTADCGFHVASVQRLRLRGIDTPELTSVAGQKARAYVEQALGTAGLVVLTTQRTDRYGRYLADVRYLPGSEDPREVLSAGTYLNRELLDRGLAWGYG